MGYRTTGTMLTVWQQTDDLESRRVELAIARERVTVELEQVVNDTRISSGSLSGGGLVGDAPVNEAWQLTGHAAVLFQIPIGQCMYQGYPMLRRPRM